MRTSILMLTLGLCVSAQAQTESEPNDNTAQANTLTLGTARTGDIGPAPCASGSSDDWFSLVSTEDGMLSLSTGTTSSGGGGTLRVHVYDSNGNQLTFFDHAAGSVGSPANQTSTFACASKGTYFFRLVPLSSDCFTYSFIVTRAGAVFGDDLEPNNSTIDASSNALVAAGTNTDGHINFNYGGDNDDWYRIQTVDDGTLAITVDAEGAAGGTLRTLVYDNNGNQLTYLDAPVGTNATPVSTGASFGCHGQSYYYIRLTSVSGCGISYRWSYALTTPVFGNETEPDNSTAQAHALAHNTITSGHLNFSYTGDNDDWYSIATPVEGSITITIIAENDGGGTIRTLIYDSNGVQLNYFDAGIGANHQPDTTSATFDCHGQGNYYLRVQSISGCGVGYQLKYRSAGAVYADDVEPDNTPANAVTNGALTPNTFADGHINFNYYGDNDDWYFIQTQAEGTLHLTTVAERVPAAAGTLRILVYDGNANQLSYYDATVGGGSAATTTSADFDCLGQGDYYLRAVSINGCGISYRLKYQVFPAVYANDAEPDNSMGQALTLAHNTFAEGHVNFSFYGDNDDWYAIQTPDDGKLSITCIAERVPAAAGTIRVLVYDSNGNQLNYFDANAGGGSIAATTVQDFDCFGKGGYYMRVQSISGCGISYRLKYQLVPAVFGNDPEPNNSFALAGALNPDSVSAGGHIDFSYYGDNDDYYRAVLPSAGSIAFNIQAESGAGGSVRVLLYDVNGNQLNYEDFPVGGGHTPATSLVAFNGLGGGTYYLRLVALNGCGISYVLNCNDNDGDGVCNYFDLCAGGPEPGTACDDNNACTLGDVILANCTCAGSFQDSDADGTCDVNDGCPTDPNKIAPGTCGCFTAEPGSICDDGNPTTINDAIGANCVCAGTMQGNDCNGVPGGPALPGTVCDDNNACTTNDTWSNSCVCQGTYNDTDGDGTCDANDGCPTDPNKTVPGTCGCGVSDVDADSDGTPNCNDGCPNDPNKIAPGICGCGNVDHANGETCDDGNACTVGDAYQNCVCVSGAPLLCNDNNPCTSDACLNGQCVFTPLPDSDGDGICDATDNCPNAAGVQGGPCNDNNPCTVNDVLTANCQCGGTLQDGDGDGICDANDNCPDNPGQIGSACNDGDPNTINDVLNANCVCMGTTGGGCTQNLTLSIKLDGNPGQTTWKLYNAAETTVVLQGGPFAANQANTTVNVPVCVAQGCYHLRVLDSGGNGIAGGGYALKDASGRRIIDASVGVFTSLSEIDNGPNNRAFCVPLTNLGMQAGTSCDLTRPRTSPIYCNTQPGASGYQFWLFDPHGTYNRRVLKSSNSLVPSSLITAPVPCGKDLNVRARALVGNAYREFGPACRIKFTGCAASAMSEGHERALEVAQEAEVGTTLVLLPNPSHDGRIVLRMDDIVSDEGSTARIDMYDMTGQQVYGMGGLAVERLLGYSIDLSDRLRSGIYVVSVTIDDQRYAQRLVIE